MLSIAQKLVDNHCDIFCDTCNLNVKFC